MSLTQSERDILTHCLGYNYTPRMQRNQFLATDGSVDWNACDGLVKRGLMANRGRVNLGVPETLFMATPAGEALVQPWSSETTVGDIYKRARDHARMQVQCAIQECKPRNMQIIGEPSVSLVMTEDTP